MSGHATGTPPPGPDGTGPGGTGPSGTGPDAGPGVLDHAGVVVTDLEAAVRFFTDRFAARVLFRLDRVADPTGNAPARLGAPREASFALAMLALGPGRLELLQWWTPDGQPAPAPPHAVGAAHVGIRVADVAGTLDRLREAPEVRVLSEPTTFDAGPTPGLTNAFVQTGWGLLLELVHWGTDQRLSTPPH